MIAIWAQFDSFSLMTILIQWPSEPKWSNRHYFPGILNMDPTA